MTDKIKHECGIAMVRLLKPLAYYQQKYGSYLYGLNKLYLMMEKQHNRGQEGAGLVCIKLHAEPGEEYIFRERAVGTGAIQEVFDRIRNQTCHDPDNQASDTSQAEMFPPFAGELYMGHLRYSTTGRSGLSYIHPFLRRNNWRSKNLALCGNFNMTNVDEIFGQVVDQGQHPRNYADTFILLEQIGHELDQENQRLYERLKKEGFTGKELTSAIEDRLDVAEILRRAAGLWDGGYVICGLTGSGNAFALRDPWGIRPAFYYADDEIIAIASERPVIQTTINVSAAEVKELAPGSALIIDKEGRPAVTPILTPKKYNACSFERIYFSRGSDQDIYRERKKLGRNLTAPILKAIGHDLEHTVFSFIPNTAEVAFYGMLEGLEDYLDDEKMRMIRENPELTPDELRRILHLRVRSEKVAIKDIKLRTFIAKGETRNDLAAHVYDITYGTVTPGRDNLVVIDDSIVRGTTLKQSIIKILDRLAPRSIVIVSSSPQIRYPDCYGIDMSRMNEFIAFRAAIALLKERGMEEIIQEVYRKCLLQQDRPKEEIVNHVKEIYAPFTEEEISDKISEMLTPEGTRAEVKIVYQSVEGLHNAIPDHPGDWYFTGNYPTPGGNRLVNRAFINYINTFELKNKQTANR